MNHRQERMYARVEPGWEPLGRRRTSAAGLLLIGLLVGLGVGLYYAWVLEPVAYIGAIPARLSGANQQEYIVLVSQSYAADQDWPRARQRLSLLDDDAIAQTVVGLLESFVRTGRPAPLIRNLANLARQLDADSPAVSLFADAPPREATVEPEPGASLPIIPPTWTPTPLAPHTPTPAATPSPGPSPTAVPVYRLLSRERVCERSAAASRIEVVILDAALEPLPGVEVIVSWDGGSDNFFSGFQPEKGLGYADFEMSEGVVYSLFVAQGSSTVEDLRIVACDAGEGGLAGGWRLTFQNSNVFGQMSP
jgi:hypothetical protein